MSKYKVSFYTNMYKTLEGEVIDLESFLLDIKNEKFKAQIENLRTYLTLGNKEQYKKEKTKLASITPSGTFTQRKEIGLLQHSNILGIDFDNLENPTAAKAEIVKEKWVLTAFISPSNNGLKVFVKIDAKQHKQAFQSLKEHFKNTYQINSDKGCHDLSRLCFVSIDKDIFINFDCETYQPTQNNITEAPHKNKSLDQKPISKKTVEPGLMQTKTTEQIIFEVETITQRIEQSKKVICNDYNEWLKCCFALSTLGEAGRDFFYRISNQYTGNETITAEKQFNDCLKQNKQGVNIQSFFYLAKNAGIDTVVKDKIAIAPPASTTNKKISFKNNYGDEITDRERIELSINEIFEVRRNIILDRIECRELDKDKANFEAANEDDISRELELKRVKNCSPLRIRSVLNSKFVKSYNPFKEYFENLPTYDKKTEPDYIQQLAEIVQLKNESEDRERFNKHLKKALVRCVACSLAEDVNNLHYNKHAIIFISPNQSIGKTGFIRFLIPKPLELYCIERMTFGNRDEQFAMQSSFIINLDEMADIDERNLQSVKTAMSTGIINVRKMNSGQRLIQPRRCNFWGNTNETNILKDDTGSVRWLCFEVLGFNKDSEYWKEESDLFVDINKVWAMAYELFKNGFPFQLTPNEIIENEKANEMYKEESIESQLVKTTFRKSDKLKDNLKTTAQIMQILSIKNPIFYSKLNITKIGSALRNLGFIQGQEFDKLKGYQNKGYYVIET